MICPSCKEDQNHVKNVRESKDGLELVRWRVCLMCDHRWATREVHASRLPGPLPKIRDTRKTPNVRSLVMSRLQKKPATT